MTLTVVTVCTGNICRSPLAEGLLLNALPGLHVSSAGTGALVGRQVPEQAASIVSALGVDVSRHRARQITPDVVNHADLLLAMAREHRRAIVELAPSAMRRVFTVRELARILDWSMPQILETIAVSDAVTPEERIRVGIAAAATLRGTTPPPESAEDFDVVDPYRRDDRVYQLSFDQLRPAVETVAAFLKRAAVSGGSDSDLGASHP